MIIRACDDYFLIKVFDGYKDELNIFDIDSIKSFFQSIIDKLIKKYNLHGLVEVDVYVNDDYGMIIEMRIIESYFDEIDMKINMHLNNLFLIEIDSNFILDYDDVYYYMGKFYGSYNKLSDNEVFYKNTNEIINKGVRVC